MVYERLAALLPKRTVEWMEKELQYVDLHVEAQEFAGFLVGFGLGISMAIGLNAYVFLGLPFLSSFVFSFVIFTGGALYWINNIAGSKGKFVESILPDALQLIASNIKAGLTTERALFVSARPEFGPLSEELQQTSKRILSGERLEKALLRIPKKIKSKVLERTMWLIAEGIKSGGQIADLLIELSQDLREENALKAEVNANISMYIMLIFFSAAFGAPMLFAISSHIVGVLSEQTANIGISEEDISEYAATSPVLRLVGIPQLGITEDFVVFFSQIALFFTCIFAALTIGVISTGSEKGGIKYAPAIIAVAFALFHIGRAVAEQFLGNAMFMM